MPKVECEVTECELENENGNLVPGVEVTCSKCGHTTQSFGTSSRSIKRCLVLLREECPRGEKNFYAADEQDDLEDQEARAPSPSAGRELATESKPRIFDDDDIPW